MNVFLNAGRAAAGFLLVALLSACGGGGGGGSADAAAPGRTDTGVAITPPSSADAVGGFAILTWQAPNVRDDGTCLSDLDEYRVNYGLSPGVYDKLEAVPASNMSCVETAETDACGRVRTCSYMIDNLDTASWYFTVQAVDSGGNVSEFSNEVIKTVQ